MGGLGSGRWTNYAKTYAVEDCRYLRLSAFYDCGLHGDPDDTHVGTIRYADGYQIGFLLYPAKGRLGLHYRSTVEGMHQDIDQTIGLQRSPMPQGGSRWWFKCHRRLGPNTVCIRRVTKLYRPPGAIHFACRHCYRLAYRSSRRNHRANTLIKLIALRASIREEEVVRILNQSRMR